MEKKTEYIGLRVTPNTLRNLKALAEKNDRSCNYEAAKAKVDRGWTGSGDSCSVWFIVETQNRYTEHRKGDGRNKNNTESGKITALYLYRQNASSKCTN